MTSLRVVVSRVRGLLRWRRHDAELSEEIQAHLDLLSEAQMRRGLSPADARAAARREFGGVDQMVERYRDQRGLPFLEVLVQDVRYAVRTLRRSPGFAVSAVLSLALGIGANTAIFNLLDAVLLKSLPVVEPEQLLVLRTGDYSYPAFQAFRQQNQAFVDLFASAGVDAQDVQIGSAPVERASVSLVSGSYFSVLGVPASVGRTFTADEDRTPGAHPIAVASHGYWQRRLGGDPAVLGSTIRINGTPMTIIGVTPPGFFGELVGAMPDLWVPLTMWAQVVPGRDLLRSPTTSWLRVIGRLRTDASVSQAEAFLTSLYRHVLTEAFGSDLPDDTRREIAAATVTLQPADKGLSALRASFSRPLQVLMVAVALVLVIACANVANLLLARATARRREIGLRLALGIGRGRLIRQLLTESLVLASLSAVLGLVFAWGGREVLLRLVSADGSRLPLAVGTDVRLLAFVALLSIACCLLSGLAPAWSTARVMVVPSVGISRDVTGRPGRFALSQLLVISQVALSVVLLVGAGLFMRTLVNLRDVNLGFAPERLLVIDIIDIMDVNPSPARYDAARYAALCRQLLRRISTVSGVESVTFSENGALTGRDSSTNRLRPIDFVPGRDGIPSARFDVVGPEYFGTMGISRLAGRDIDERDDESARLVVVINQAMARRFYGDASPIGKRMVWGIGEGASELEIIGVARDVKQRGARDEAQLRFYVPYFQHPQRILASIRFLVRTVADPAPVSALLQQAIRLEDARVRIESVDLATDLVARTLSQERMLATLSSAFGGLALALASVGLYGLMAYRVARRTSEIGIRMALGAQRRTVLYMVLRQDLALVAAGIAIGAPLAVAACRLTQNLFFGIDAGDPTTLIAAMVVMTTIGMFAGLVPARRAARIEPAMSLRHD